MQATYEDARILLLWQIRNTQLRVPGAVFIAIRGYDGTGTMRYTSYKTPVYVEDAINTPEGKPGLSEFERLEKELNAGLGKAEEATNKADTAAGLANSAATRADDGSRGSGEDPRGCCRKVRAWGIKRR